MCTTCGCESHTPSQLTLLEPGMSIPVTASHVHSHSHNEAPVAPPADSEAARLITLERDILHKNNLLAAHNRGYFEGREIVSINLVSSPGSGKTSLLERTITDLKAKVPCAVIEGDQQTALDAARVAATGVPAIQINTGKGCHLDAEMVRRAVRQLKPQAGSLLFIENVGNLVCPAMFDLGEQARVVIMSVTEGDDKPLKYPDMFHSADICLINKIDLLPYVNFNVERFKEYARQVSHIETFFEVSATTGQGMEDWYQWLMRGR